jgi:hypothetical protein
MLADHGMRPEDAAPVLYGPGLIDTEAQIATLQQLDPTNPALPQLRAAAGRGDLATVKRTLGALDNGTQWGKWITAILAIAGLVAVYWWWSTRKKKRRPAWRRNDEPDDADFADEYDGNDYEGE